LLFDLWRPGPGLESGMVSSVMEMAGFSFIVGIGGGAYVGGGGAEVLCCGIVGGARVGICGGVALVLCVGLRVFAADCCSLGRVKGRSMSSGNRKECILADFKAIEYVCDLRTRPE
jgi:hypothetical protein